MQPMPQEIPQATVAQALDFCTSLRISAKLAMQAASFNQLYAEEVPSNCSLRRHYLVRALDLLETSVNYDRMADAWQAVVLEMLGVVKVGNAS